MTPATSQAPSNLRKQVGPAVWLLCVCVHCAPAEWNGAAPMVSAIWRVIQERSIAITGKVVEDLSAEEGLQLATDVARGSENVGEAQEARS